MEVWTFHEGVVGVEELVMSGIAGKFEDLIHKKVRGRVNDKKIKK